MSGEAEHAAEKCVACRGTGEVYVEYGQPYPGASFMDCDLVCCTVCDGSGAQKKEPEK